MALKGKNYIVTGAAQGIDENVARALAAENANLYLCDIQTDKVKKVAADLGAASGPVDISIPESAKRMYQAV